jgi:hypothetical protein
MADAPDQPAGSRRWKWRAVLLAIVGLFIIGCLYLVGRFTRDEPVTYTNPEDHFKYGSTGGERESGIPYWIWKVLPKMFPEYLPGKTYTPGKEYVSLGFLYERGKDLPIGVSRRNTQGLDRVFLNCAICHAGSVRETPQSTPIIYAGMPSNTVDLEAFERFIFACATDQRFNAPRIMSEIEAIGGRYDFLNRFLLRFYAIPFMRERLLMLKGHFRFAEWEPDAGPGRTDTFNPAKTLLEFPLEKLETRELVGLCDFPSIWLQGLRKQKNLHAHWDGNNSLMEERNKSASFGTGAFPPAIDLKQLARVEQWLLTKEPPKYPFVIDAPNTVPVVTDVTAAISTANTSATSRRSTKSALTVTGSIPTPKNWPWLRTISMPVIRGVSAISGKLSDTQTCRSTAYGCARRICITAQYPHCAIC